MKTKMLLLFAILSLNFSAHAATWYVRSTGNDTSGDGSLGNPYATLGKAITSAATSGDVIDIYGTFSVTNISMFKSFTIQGTNNQNTIFTGSASKFSSFGTAGTVVTIENITFQGYTGGVMSLNTVVNQLTLRNCVFQNNSTTAGNPGGAINIGAATPILIEDCYFYNNQAGATGSTGATGGAVSISTGNVNSSVTINRCLFENNKTVNAGGSALSYASSSASPQTANFYLTNSTFVGNNLNFNATGTNQGGVSVNPSATSSTANVYLTNNTIAHNSVGSTGSGIAAGLYVRGIANKVTLINNILFSNFDSQTSPVSTSIVASVNLYESRNNITDVPSTTFNWTTKTTNGASMASGNVSSVTSGTLLLASTLTNNGGATKTLGLGIGSSAISTGYTGGTPVTVDQRNVARVGTVDVGAFEGVLISGTAETEISANIEFENLALAPGAKLTLNSGATLGVSGNLAINSDADNGTATFLDKNENGNLTISSGSTNVYQYISSIQTGVNGRNWYISSPLSAASSNRITTATGNGLVYYDGTTNWPAATTTMEVMKGYIAKSPAQNTTINFNGGILNTGAQSKVDMPLGFNLVGNPYPSYVDFAQATKTNVVNSIWYRSKKDGTYQFHTYNVSGGVGVNDGTAIIAPMQSFWIKTTSATNTFGFTNAMRLHQDQSIVTNRLKAPKVNAQKLIRLQVSNSSNSDETVIYFNSDAQNEVDDYDSQKMFSNVNEMPEIFMKNGTSNLVINGMNSIPFDTEIPLGFTTGETGNFNISAPESKNFEFGTRIFLKDKLNPSVETEFYEGAIYKFYAQPTAASTERFSLVFRAPTVTTSIGNPEKLNVQIFVNSNNQISIIAPERCIFSIYNSVGQKVYEGLTISKCSMIDGIKDSGVFVVRVTDNVRNYSSRILLNAKNK